MTIRLMLVDDHQMVRETLKRSMADEGFDVVGEAGDGDEAIAAARRCRPDVILMDITMPNVDGIDATRRIVADRPEVRVVMLTMHDDDELLAAAIRAGAAGYLTKDSSFDEVASTVRMAASGTALSPRLAASMLDEVRRLEREPVADEPPVTKREVEVLQLIADGRSTPEVAGELFISQKTVKNHLASIYQKLETRDRTQAVLRAVRMGIVSLD